ncbi:dapper homolog 3 isoform X2 [Tachysurus fulvidraco]|uniref:dapper homolog 3 isoform X2 n=1 Tax=Tachysurus fulvidraco TaxID=1234273 RepID=UPI001FF05036|nr:dapper homolog 3 isoform X2 [Tachysurus fulvidraco]
MMHRAFSFAMAAERSRYKERLEATLAGLCELEMLKQRQESLVLSALSLGDSVPGCVRAPWPLIRHCFPNSANLEQEPQAEQQGSMAVLQQQVGELRVDTENSSLEHPTDTGDTGPSSGFCEQRESQSPLDSGDLSSRTSFPIQSTSSSERLKSVDTFVTSRDGLQDCGGSTGRSPVPRSLSGPQPPLMGLSKRGGEVEHWLWPESNEAGDEVDSTAEDYHQAQNVETYIVGLIQRRLLATKQCKPRTNMSPEARGVMRQSSLCCKEPVFIPDHCKVSSSPERPKWCTYNLEEERLRGFSPGEQLPSHYPRLEEQIPAHFSRPEEQHPSHYPRPEDKLSTQYSRAALPGIHSTSLDFTSGDLDPSSSEADSPHHYQLPHSPSSEEQLVNAQYIPAQPCQAPMRAKTSRAHAAPKASRGGDTYSPERPQPKPRAMPKKCRFSEEKTTTKKPGRKACRSQSENSLLGQKGVPERKYSTVERDTGRTNQSKSRRQQASLGHRRWRSTLELSQDEAEPTPEREVRRTRRSRPTASAPTYVYNQTPQHLHSHHPHHFPHPQLHSDYPLQTSVCRPEGGYKHSGPGEWESSLSEGESPGSSSMSSDSDESGGLVWPQQLAPPLAPPSPPTPSGAPLQSKALVKIKASHALKKKILRFRTGSLKVMTTV